VDEEVRVDKLWGPIAWLALTLRRLAARYVDPLLAQRLTRQTMWRVYLQAVDGTHTDVGPYFLALEYLAIYLAQELAARGISPQDMAEQTWPLPSKEQLSQLCDSYALVHEAVYLGQWSRQDIAAVGLLLRYYDLVDVQPLAIYKFVELGDVGTDPLRRALHALRDHAVDGELICDVATDLADSETAKSHAWLDRMEAEEAIPPWPR